ncbi:FAD-dependent oxidoreductase [Candidatus Saccharibacteria bacterium]|nr:FAD-dependent oxidoreductase [Candidatus Saccharibacteria bacterium]
MGKKYDYDYIIIGSGPAGSTLGLELARAGRSVAIIENRFFGGSNIATSKVPGRATFDFSHTYSHILSFPELKNQEVRYNLPAIPARQYQTITRLSRTLVDELKGAGVVCVEGFATFSNAHTVMVGKKQYTAAYFIIATGAHASCERITGVAFVNHFTPATAIRLTMRPKVAAVVGGGASGVEIAEYYAELGVKVLLFEKGERLVANEDPEVGEVLTRYFTDQHGITVLTGCEVHAIEEDELSQKVVFSYKGTNKMVRVDCIVLATGTAPNTERLNLEAAGVKYSEKGVTVNKYFETSARNIYAIGDCLGYRPSPDRANLEALSLASGLINKNRVPANYSGLMRTIMTYPEVAAIGYTESQLIKKRRKYNRALIPLRDTEASAIYRFDYGFVKILAERTGHILGATVVAPGAELIMAEIALALRHNLTVLELASTPHPLNSYGYIVKLAAKELLTNKKAKAPAPIIVREPVRKPAPRSGHSGPVNKPSAPLKAPAVKKLAKPEVHLEPHLAGRLKPKLPLNPLRPLKALHPLRPIKSRADDETDVPLLLQDTGPKPDISLLKEKPVTKPVVNPTVGPAVKPPAKPAMKPAVRPVVKPAARPLVKPAVKPIQNISNKTIPVIISENPTPISVPIKFTP